MRAKVRRNGERGAGILAVVVLIAVAAGVAVFLANVFARYRIEQVRNRWNDPLGSWEEFLRRYPATEANGSAIEVERLAAPLGISLVPRFVEDREGPTREQQKGFRQLKRDVFGNYLVGQIQGVGRDTLEEPPPSLVEYIADHDAELIALRRQLLDAPVPVWESDMSLAVAAPLPNLLGHIDLHKLLALVALARARTGDTQGALLDIEASWRLNRSIEDSPILISQLIAVAARRLQAGVLRRIPDVPEIWISRLQEHDFRESLLTAMKFEGRVWLELDDGDFNGDGRVRWFERMAAPVVRPYSQVCLASLSDAWRKRLERLSAVDALCDYDLSEHDAGLDIPVPRWNLIGKTVVPNLVHAIDRVARLELDLELTRLVLEADAARRVGGESWAASLAGVRLSEACPEDRWIYAETDGGLDIAFQRDIAWPEQLGAILPTRARLD